MKKNAEKLKWKTRRSEKIVPWNDLPEATKNLLIQYYRENPDKRVS